MAKLQPPTRGPRRPLSVAPMMDRTDRHFRAFMRRITRHTFLYTEMVTTGAILQGGAERHLAFDPVEKPLALQLGGDDPGELARCARIAEQHGYDEVNLNVGCPSARVQKGRFGACLMREPHRVADAVAAMREAAALPVTVKHRIGVDELDRYEDLRRFVEVVAAAGCDRFAVHARKAWLHGLSPKENREVPPLRYADVYRLKEELPAVRIEINGGIRPLADLLRHLERLDGVMIGRAAYDDPYAFAAVDRVVYGSEALPPSRREVLEGVLEDLERWLDRGVPLQRLTRHLLGLFAGRPGSRLWKRHLSDNAHRPGAGVEVLRAAMARLPSEVLDEPPPVSVETAAQVGMPLVRGTRIERAPRNAPT